jgi:hypothetical protein
MIPAWPIQVGLSDKEFCFMRRVALLGSLLLLSACSGFGGFLGDTLTVRRNVNAPQATSDNIRRAMGQQVDVTPLLPEPGNVWPGPARPEPTLEDIARDQANPGAPAPVPSPRGSSTPPGGYAPVPQAGQLPPVQSPPMPSRPPASSSVVQTPRGQAVITNGGNGVQQYTAPGGGSGTAVTNGNGTVTLVSPDGAVTSAPAPR